MNARFHALLLAGLTLPVASGAAVIHSSPEAAATGTGTAADPVALATAITSIAAGDTILLADGTYSFSAQITIDTGNSGISGKRKCLMAESGAHPVFDFSGETYVGGGDSNPRGLQINGNWWHVKGITFTGAADNGMFIAGNCNIIESCVFHKNKDSGLQISRRASTLTDIKDWPSYDTILNCESYDNYDEPGDNGKGAGENADGFACKLSVGPGCLFRNCNSHHNIDDGWDLYTKAASAGYGPIGTVTLDHCISHHNGTLTDGTTNPSGDRNGFKLGGSDMANRHIVTRCAAYANGHNGFTWNSNPGAILLANNLAFDNAEGNYKFGSSADTTLARFWNNISWWTSAGSPISDAHHGADVDSSNCWWDKSKKQPSINLKGLIVTSADFAVDLSAYSSGASSPVRLADSTLDFSVFALAEGSDLINAGVLPVDDTSGLIISSAWYGSTAPDLGPVQYASATTGMQSASHAAASLGAGVRVVREGNRLKLRVVKPGAPAVSLLGRK